jgi:hypothetical protein
VCGKVDEEEVKEMSIGKLIYRILLEGMLGA